MQLHCDTAKLTGMRAFAAPLRCPHCGDDMVAPMVSEFVEGGEIRHHWECDACGQPTTTLIPLDPL
jgi:transcription elongation factor Elf1